MYFVICCRTPAWLLVKRWINSMTIDSSPNALTRAVDHFQARQPVNHSEIQLARYAPIPKIVKRESKLALARGFEHNV